ncbi:MAG: DUF4827 domain-containing protein [Bacteroidaceae bacterium]|nr:DUF4827 domain-containing protein [Bacteroidaceae bacterium]
MKRIYSLIFLFLGVLAMTSCRDNETYADLKKKERKAINAFIEKNSLVPNIEVISESEFNAQDSLTKSVEAGDATNQFVLFSATGVYMQIVSKGDGAKLKDGETKTVLCRYTEHDILDGDTLSTNIYYPNIVDKMIVKNTSGSYSATFTEGNMYATYNKSSYVPQGWLVPFSYINLGRNTANLARVRLIVPHSYGTATASSSVYPCFYEITFEAGR